MPTSLSNITVKDSSHTLIVKSNDITIDGTSIQTQINNKANDADVVHKTGNESISGAKTFTSAIQRTANLNSSGTALLNLTDTNGKGSVNQSSYYVSETLYNRLNTVNATSNKEGYIEVQNKDDGTFRASIGGNGTNLSLTRAVNATTDNEVPTKGWVNNPATSTNVVHRSGNETIAGLKTFSNIPIVLKDGDMRVRYQASVYTQGTAPSSNCYGGSRITDKNNVEMGSLYTAMYTDGTTASVMQVKSPVADSSATAAIKVISDASGNFYTQAPTPATSDNSTKIATTAWVKAQGYSSGGQATWGSVTGTLSNQTDLNTALENKANNSDVVKLTGSQTVAGQKTFTDRLVLQQSSVQPLLKSTGYTKGTAPTSDTYMCHRTYSDKNGAGVFDEYYYIQGNTNKNRYILRFQNVSSASATGYKDIITADFDGTTSTYAVNATTATAPTPATSDNSTKIATTAYVKSQGYITSSGSITGSAAKLTTKRTIDGVEFDGSANITHYGTCSTAAATQEKVVECTGFKLETGAVICVKFTAEANGADNPTLNVNSTGAKAIQYRGSAISKGYLRINRTYVFVYDGTYYQLIGDLDNNTTDRLQITNNIIAATAITAGRAIVGTSAGYKNIGSGITFDISYPILVAGSAISASGTGTTNFRAISSRSVRDITGNSSWTGTQYATVYLVLSALNGVTATIDSTLVTTTVPTSADNKFYIPIGYMYSTYQCYFCPQDKIYAYVDGKFQEYGSAGGDTSDCVKKSECEEVQCVIETYVNGTSWYRVWSDGWCEQGGGFGDAYTAYTTKTITFLKAFANTNYNLQMQSSSTSALYEPAISALTTTSFTAINTCNQDALARWYACGY